MVYWTKKDFLSDQNRWWTIVYISHLSCCLCAKAMCLACEVQAGKKACVWQQGRLSRWRLPNSCLCVGSPGICNDIMALKVICRVIVLLV